VTILSKTDVRPGAGNDMAAEMRTALDRYRQELGTDYIDIMLLHGMRSPNWPTEMKPVMDVLSEAKEKGIIRTHGASIHSLDAMKMAAKTPWCQVHLQGINHAGVRMDATPAEVVAVLRQSKAAGKGTLGMKILGEGRLRDQINKTLNFVLGLDCLDCFTIGAANRDELSDLIKRVPASTQAA
jgi:predicted aldo/keto reductase-like oxidoreductase